MLLSGLAGSFICNVIVDHLVMKITYVVTVAQIVHPLYVATSELHYSCSPSKEQI